MNIMDNNYSNYINNIELLKPLDPDKLFDLKENIILPYIKLNPYKSSEIARLPYIGWFGRKRIGYIIIIVIILVIIYYFFYKKQSEVISIGCINNGCKATPCYGPECNADNCTGIGCHAGDCYGEGCNGGTCEGTGCKGGDCYGSNCIVGKCIDPNCPETKEKDGLCTPNCSKGRAYNIPKSSENIVNTIKNNLLFNTYFNQNLCIKPNYISQTMLKDDKILYNFDVKGAYYYYGGYNSIDEIKDLVSKGTVIDDVKGVIRYNDPIMSTVPNIYKNNNCNWSTIYDNNEISARLVSSYVNTKNNNVNNDDYYWSTLKTQVVNYDTKGNETMCPLLLNMGTHDFINITYYLDINQLKDILGIQTLSTRMANVDNIEKSYISGNINDVKTYMDKTDFYQDKKRLDDFISILKDPSNNKKLFEQIENIRGTIMTGSCSRCNQIGNRVLANNNLPVDIFGKNELCRERVYIYNKTVENYDPSATIDKSIVSYQLTNMKLADKDVFTISDKELFINDIYSIKNHHLMFYYDTDIVNKTMIYMCFFCQKKSYLKLNKLITDNRLVNNIGMKYSLGNCIEPDDFNHYMYEVLSDTQNIYYKCLKCLKTTI